MFIRFVDNEVDLEFLNSTAKLNCFKSTLSFKFFHLITDIKVKEKSLQSLMQKKAIYEPPRFMSISQAADQLIQALESKGMENENCVFDKESYCVGLARVGTDEQKIVRMQLKDMLTEDFGKPLHSLIIEGFLHPLEKEMLSLFEKDNKVC